MDTNHVFSAEARLRSKLEASVAPTAAPQDRRKFVDDAIAWVQRGGRIDSLFPIVDEWRADAGVASGQYFHQDLVVAQWIHEAKPRRHVDVGSRVDGFVAHVAAFREIEVFDIRPLGRSVRNIRFVRADLQDPASAPRECADSVSCLHALEHFGLGRYGDAVDPEGHLRGFQGLVRMVEPGGTLYLSVPVGKARVEFNAHRVFEPREPLSWPGADSLQLVKFAYVDDAGELRDDMDPLQLASRPPASGLGIYVFRKGGSGRRASADSRRIVTYPALGRNGNLGNQLFQVASTIGIARRNGADAVFPPWENASLFAGTFAQSDRQLAGATKRLEKGHDYHAVDIDGPTELFGYLQSEKYFAGCADEIRALFAPNARIAAQLDQAWRPVANLPTCSLHVRRGDYIGLDVLVDLSASGYYERAIAQLPQDTLFLVFSDDIAWCKRRFAGGRFHFVEGLSPAEDLFLMSRCRAHIIANSTFSWWGAWLDPRADKRVIAPRSWFAGAAADRSQPFRAGPPNSGFHDDKDLIPDGWIKV